MNVDQRLRDVSRRTKAAPRVPQDTNRRSAYAGAELKYSSVTKRGPLPTLARLASIFRRFIPSGRLSRPGMVSSKILHRRDSAGLCLGLPLSRFVGWNIRLGRCLGCVRHKSAGRQSGRDGRLPGMDDLPYRIYVPFAHGRRLCRDAVRGSPWLGFDRPSQPRVARRAQSVCPTSAKPVQFECAGAQP